LPVTGALPQWATLIGYGPRLMGKKQKPQLLAAIKIR